MRVDQPSLIHTKRAKADCALGMNRASLTFSHSSGLSAHGGESIVVWWQTHFSTADNSY